LIIDENNKFRGFVTAKTIEELYDIIKLHQLKGHGHVIREGQGNRKKDEQIELEVDNFVEISTWKYAKD
jgi:hypothetical protein